MSDIRFCFRAVRSAPARPRRSRNIMTENLFSHPAEAEYDTAAARDAVANTEPTPMPVFSHRDQ